MREFQSMAAAGCLLTLSGALLATPGLASAQSAEHKSANAAEGISALRADLSQARAQIADQSRQINEQQRRLELLEQRLSGLAQATQQIRDQVTTASPPSSSPLASNGIAAPVGEPPKDSDRPPTVAVLDQQGTVVTRKGQLIGEVGVDYTRSDRNVAIFRGVEIPEALLIGVFDINQSRQDIVSASASLRYGLTKRLEVGVRVPYLYRSDSLVTAPVAGSTSDDAAGTIDSSTKGSGLGDIELSGRYQINNGGHNRPFLIANLQATIPTGRSPFSIRRDSATGAPLQSATGAGFWGITPGLTVILPSEPAVLFGTIGYTFNLARKVNTRIPPVQIDMVNPGDQINFSGGIGISLNDRTSFNFGYSHSYVFGTTTLLRQIDGTTGALSAEFSSKSRSLQIGRLLFGITQKFSEKFQVNWSVQVGVTQDAPDVLSSLRVPISF